MEVLNVVRNLESKETFKEFKEHFPSAYLAHLFLNLNYNPGDDVNLISTDGFQVGYFNLPTDEITIFDVNPLRMHDPQKAFKKDDTHLLELDIGSVKIDLEDINKVLMNTFNMKYSAHPITRKIFILQTIDGKPTWNVTFITSTFYFYNVKVNAISGTVIKEDFQNLMSLKAN